MNFTKETKVKVLKEMLKGLISKRNFDPDNSSIIRPHCVIGEKNRVCLQLNQVFRITDLLPRIDSETCYGGSTAGLTHKLALQMIRRAIKRESK